MNASLTARTLADLLQDIRYGLRTLAASPGFAVVSIISLSLGIAVGTSGYSEMRAMVLRDIPVVWKPAELVALQAPVSYPLYKRLRGAGELFSSTAAYVAPVPFGIAAGGRTERVWGQLVTPSYFGTLGVRPLFGRWFNRQENQPGQPPVAVLSYRFWRGSLGADPAAVGRTLRVNGQPCTVIGIGPRDFVGASPALFPADVWMPVSVGGDIAPELAGNALERADLTMFQMVGRLNPGVSETRAEAELDAVSRKADEDFGGAKRGAEHTHVALLQGGKMLPLRRQDLPFFTEFFIILFGLVMLIACSNVANMTLARATGRRREIAVRLALGASRARLIRQLLTECMLVAAGAGLLGFAICCWMMDRISGMSMPYPMPVAYDLRPDWHALVFTIILTAGAGLAFGLAPALRATRTDITPVLKESGNLRPRGYRRLSLRNMLVLSQLAASLMLLLLTGFLSLGIQGTLGIQQGFDPRNLYLVSLDPVRDGYSADRAAAFCRTLLDRVKRMPLVTGAALTDTIPAAMNGNHWVALSETGGRRTGEALRYVVGSEYFETARIPVVMGRSFGKADETNEATSVIVTEELVRRFWKGQNPVGRQIEIGNGEVLPSFISVPGTFDFRPIQGKTFEVIGVAKDVNEDFVAKKLKPSVYFPLRPADYARPSVRGITLIVRADPSAGILTAVQREIAAMDPGLKPFNARSMTEQISQFIAPLRAAAWTYGVIGLFGLILASVGLAGVTAYSVAQRGHEIGIRMALGARPVDVLRLVMREGAVLVVVGAALGLTMAWGGITLLSGLFSSVASTRATDPALVIGAPLLLAGLAMAACYAPARQSTRIDPAVALRQE